MKTFTAKTLHDNPSEVYRAAVKEPVKVTHKHHGDMVILSKEVFESRIRNALDLPPDCGIDVEELIL